MKIKTKNKKIISGAIHYCRVTPEYWEDRLQKLANLGCNTVETVIPWNFHEYDKGTFNFSYDRDIRQFIQLAHACGLEVILRPGPYICAEWEYGGLPYWLLEYSNMRVRTNDKHYLYHSKIWFEKLYQQIGDLQVTNGGPIIMMQIENEFGYYSNDKKHLSKLKSILIEIGFDCQFFTSDGLYDGDGIVMGNLLDEDVLPTLNMGGAVEERYKIFRELFGQEIPFFNMEYWVGWFNLYGQPHLFRSKKSSVENYIKALEFGHTNLYVFHGGTNFGYYAGANHINNKTEALITSYDYDAILTESGQRSHKYDVFRQAISKYVNNKEDKFIEEPIEYISNINVPLSSRISLLENYKELLNISLSDFPKTQEQLKQFKGFTFYKTTIDVQSNNKKRLQLNKCADRAHLYLNQEHVHTFYDNIEEEIEVEFVENSSNEIIIIVENLGRVNLHQKMDFQTKGICHSVRINEHIHVGWESAQIDLDTIFTNNITTNTKKTSTPILNTFILNLNEIGDTYIDLHEFGKGYVLVNGFNIGAYWNIGPQTRLYIPKYKFKKGINTINIFDIEGTDVKEINFYDKQLWSTSKIEL